MNAYEIKDGVAIIPEGTTKIDNEAFRYCGELVSVIIPDGVTEIGEYAFCECSNLVKITLPMGITTIGKRAFYKCAALADIVIPESVTSIGDSAFYGCTGLVAITIPANVTTVCSYSFYGCTALASVHIPASVTVIDEYAFRGCASLVDITIPEGVTAIASHAFCGCTSLAGITIPRGVKEIALEAFYGCKGLVDVIIPDGVEKIAENAFASCASLQTVTLPAGVNKIHKYAFKECHSLKTIYIPAKKTDYYKKRLSGALLVEQEPTNMEKTVKKPKADTAKKTTVARKAEPKFKIVEGCTAHFVDGKTVWSGVLLDGVKLPKSFQGPLVIPENVTVVGRYVCKELTQLTEVILPAGIDTLFGSAFSGCWNLEKINLPEGLIRIEPYCFEGCLSLKELHIPVSLRVRGGMFLGVPSTTKVTMAEGSKYYVENGAVYSMDNCFVRLLSDVEEFTVKDGTKSIGSYAFSKCRNLKKIILPASVDRIDSFAFDKSITTIVVSDETVRALLEKEREDNSHLCIYDIVTAE